MGRLIQELQAAWTSVSFQVDQVSLIWRGEPPDDVFRVGATILLGGEPK
ncbi:MAG: hypothetical protein ACLQNE_38680 [Thermoguttaceae bacterium]